MYRSFLLLCLFCPLLAWTQPEPGPQIPRYLARPEPESFSEQRVFHAALEGDTTLVKRALKGAFDVHHLNAEKRTLLMMAAFNGHTELCDLLLDAGARINAKDHTGTTALMFAASGPSQDTVALLLKRGASINAVDGNEHFSALMWAAAEGREQNCRLLLEKGADPSLTDIDGDTAASFAAKAGHQKVAELLTAAMEKTPPAAPAEKKQP